MVCALGLVAIGGPAHAAWLRVETDKFIVYGQSSEASLRAYATKLTTYDGLLRRFNPSTLTRKPATKVQVFLVHEHGELARVEPRMGRNVLGFYNASGDGVVAVAQNVDAFGQDDVLFHEYAHHFMLENFPAAYPAWFVEGWAEYFMTTDIKAKSIDVGGFNPARVYSIFEEDWLPLDQLLTKTTWQTRGDATDAYYAEAWLLTHYMMSDRERAAQLDKATLAISKGAPPVQAMDQATGQSLAQLTDALKHYRKLAVLSFKIEQNAPPPMIVSALPASADDMLLDSVRLILTNPGRSDPEFLAAVRKRAARHPGDSLAERTVARAEFLMGDVATGEAIMKRRLAAAAPEAEDYLLAGEGQIFAGDRDPEHRVERYRAARPLLAKAYQMDAGGDFRSLHAYGVSRTVEPGFPTDNDLNALVEARGLAPAVKENSLRLGIALVRKGRMDDARAILAPVINSPHDDGMARAARAVLAGQPISASDRDDLSPPSKPSPQPPAKTKG